MMTTPEEEQQLKKFAAVLITMLAIKSEMIAAGETSRKTECPRCGNVLTVLIAGRRNHARMGCAGLCGMQAME